MQLPRWHVVCWNLGMAKILVIEDDPNVAMAIQHSLAGAGHTVLLAANGKEGINELRRSTVDVVVTDLFMPEQEGLETITVLRKGYPKLPVIAISGGNIASDTMLKIAKDLGAQEVLQKPFGVRGLLAAVEKVLSEGVRVA
jgi:CheY-like chemotaxis protein